MTNCHQTGDLPPITYQWQFDRRDIPGATNTTLTLTNVYRLRAGGYRLAVNSSTGVTTSETAILTVIPTEPSRTLRVPTEFSWFTLASLHPKAVDLRQLYSYKAHFNS